MSVPIKVRTGHYFLPGDNLGIGEVVWDHAHPIVHRIGAGSGDVQPRWYPGVDGSGNLFMDYNATIRSAHPDHRGDSFGFEGSDFVVRCAGAIVWRVNTIGGQLNGPLTQSGANPTGLPSQGGLADLLFPLFNDKSLIAQFNRPAYAAVDANTTFRAYRDIATFLSDFSCSFTRGGLADTGFVRYVNSARNYALALANQPRIVYSLSMGKCRGLLIEPPATNLIVRSYALDQWSTISGLTLSKENPALWSTKGLNNPYSFVETGTSEHLISQIITAAPSATLTASFYFQAKTFTGTRRFCFFVGTTDRSQVFGINFNAVSGGAPTFGEYRQIGNGVVKSYEIEAIGSGIYRIKITGTVNAQDASTSASLAATFASLGDTANNANLVFTPGANTGNWCLLNDVQVEKNLQATSYIQTAAAILDRGADVLTLNLNSFKFSTLEGLLEFGFRPVGTLTVGAVLFSLRDSTGANRVDYVVSTVDTVNMLYTISANTVIGNTATASTVIGTASFVRSKILVPYSNIAAGITSLVVDGNRGFFGTVNLISYE